MFDENDIDELVAAIIERRDGEYDPTYAWDDGYEEDDDREEAR